MQTNGGGVNLSGQEQLFLGLAEQLLRPWLQVAQVAELAGAGAWPAGGAANGAARGAAAVADGSALDAANCAAPGAGPTMSATDDPAAAHLRWELVRGISQASLQLLEGYVLSLRVHGRITPLTLEPVTVSSLLYDTAQALQPFARQYGVGLELDPGPRLLPVLADRTVLQSAMTSLGQVFVLAQAESDEPASVRLSAHRSRYGVVAGLYGAAPLGADSLRRARALAGRAREPLQRLVSGPAAGVFVADSLLEALAARLHVARYRGLSGLATTLQSSQQLQLV